MKFVVVLLCIIAYFVIMMGKHRIVLAGAVKMTPDSELLKGEFFIILFLLTKQNNNFYFRHHHIQVT